MPPIFGLTLLCEPVARDGLGKAMNANGSLIG
jgi:hypothetical protein